MRRLADAILGSNVGGGGAAGGTAGSDGIEAPVAADPQVLSLWACMPGGVNVSYTLLTTHATLALTAHNLSI